MVARRSLINYISSCEGVTMLTKSILNISLSCCRNNQHNAQICTTALFIHAVFYMFRQYSAIFRELLNPSELPENTDRYVGLSHNVFKWSVCRSVVVQSVALSVICLLSPSFP
jgi:hypothetical protein